VLGCAVSAGFGSAKFKGAVEKVANKVVKIIDKYI
jgi:hypothetical protein